MKGQAAAATRVREAAEGTEGVSEGAAEGAVEGAAGAEHVPGATSARESDDRHEDVPKRAVSGRAEERRGSSSKEALTSGLRREEMLTAGWESTKGVSVRPGNRPRSMARLTAVPARPAVACSSACRGPSAAHYGISRTRMTGMTTTHSNATQDGVSR